MMGKKATEKQDTNHCCHVCTLLMIVFIFYGMNKRTHLPAVRWHYEEGLDVVFEQERVSLASVPRLHLIISIQTLQCCACDVHLPAKQPHERTTVLKLSKTTH